MTPELAAAVPSRHPHRADHRDCGRSCRSCGRGTATRLIFSLIRARKFHLNESKNSAVEVVQAVRTKFPHLKFSISQYPWYLSRFRRQLRLGLPTTRLVKIPKAKRKRRPGPQQRREITK
jgi:hypothetical protein